MEPIVELVEKHGYYKDFVNLWLRFERRPLIRVAIAQFLASRLEADIAASRAEGDGPKRISLLAKWLPRWRKGAKTNALVLAVASRVWQNGLP